MVHVDKLLVFVSIFALLIVFFGIKETPRSVEAAAQRESFLSAITTPQQMVNSMIAFFVFIPFGAAYFFYVKSKPNLRLGEIWQSIGGKIGLTSGFFSLFVIKNQIFVYLIAILLMATWGFYLSKRTQINAVTAFLIPFLPAYYYMFITMASKTPIELITFFNAATVAVFVWIIPITAGMVVYALYKNYIPFIKQNAFN